MRDIAVVSPSNEELNAAMRSCSEPLVFMGETLRLARDSKVRKRVKIT